MAERIFEGFVDEVTDGLVKAVGECKGEQVFLDFPQEKWPIGHSMKPGTIFFICVNGVYTDITFPSDETEIPEVKLSWWDRFKLWLTSIFK